MFAVGEVQQVRDPLNLLARHQILDALDHPLGADPGGQFGDDDAASPRAHLLDARRGAHPEGPSTCRIGLAHSRETEDGPAPGQVGTGDKPDEFVEARVGVEDEVSGCGHDLAEVVRCHGGRHAYGDTGGAVDQECGQPGGQDGRLQLAPVVVGDEIDHVLVEGLGHGEG